MLIKTVTSSILNLRTIILTSLTVTILHSACSTNSKEAVVLNKFYITQPIVLDTLHTSEYMADIHSLRNVELRARVNGYIERIHVDEGQTVSEGQLLFSISDQEYKQGLLKAKALLTSSIADAKVAEVDLNNIRTLVEKQVVSKSELEMAQAKWDAAMARIEEAKATEATARIQLSFTEIRAPFGGVINRITNKVGSLIDEGTLLTTLSDNREVFAYFNVSETDYLDIVADGNMNAHHSVQFLMANGKPHPIKGTIETVEGEIDKSTGNIAFRARFQNPDLVLKHGSTGKIKLNHDLAKALLIPQKSTFEIQDNLYVYTISEQNLVQLRNVRPSMRIPHLYIIESGLTSNDRILYEGIQRVKEGDRISTELIPMKQIIAQLAKL